MTTYNTNNPLGSSDPRDLYDNAGSLDGAVNGTALTWVDRLGVTRPSWKGIEANSASGSYTKRTLPELQAITPPEGTSPSGRVTEGSGKGYYVWENGTWEETDDPMDMSNLNTAFVQGTRGGIVSPEPTAFLNFVKAAVVQGIDRGKIFKIEYFQNQSDRFEPVVDTFIFAVFDDKNFNNRVQLNNREDNVVVLDRTSNKQIVQYEIKGYTVTLLLDPSALPPIGTQIRNSLSDDPGYSWYVGETGYIYKDEEIIKPFSGSVHINYQHADKTLAVSWPHDSEIMLRTTWKPNGHNSLFNFRSIEQAPQGDPEKATWTTIQAVSTDYIPPITHNATSGVTSSNTGTTGGNHAGANGELTAWMLEFEVLKDGFKLEADYRGYGDSVVVNWLNGLCAGNTVTQQRITTHQHMSACFMARTIEVQSKVTALEPIEIIREGGTQMVFTGWEDGGYHFYGGIQQRSLPIPGVPSDSGTKTEAPDVWATLVKSNTLGYFASWIDRDFGVKTDLVKADNPLSSRNQNKTYNYSVKYDHIAGNTDPYYQMATGDSYSWRGGYSYAPIGMVTGMDSAFVFRQNGALRLAVANRAGSLSGLVRLPDEFLSADFETIGSVERNGTRLSFSEYSAKFYKESADGLSAASKGYTDVREAAIRSTINQVNASLSQDIDAVDLRVATVEPFVLPRALPTNTDLNDIKTAGTYYSRSSSTVATWLNCPISVACFIEVTVGSVSGSDDSTFVYQTITSYTGNSSYRRTLYNDNWGDWIKDTTISDLNASSAQAITESKQYTDTRETNIRSDYASADSANLTAAKAYTDTNDAATLGSAKTYTDGRETAVRTDYATADATTLASAKQYADAAEASAVSASKTYTDTKDTSVRSDMAAADSATLTTANGYADEKAGLALIDANAHADSVGVAVSDEFRKADQAIQNNSGNPQAMPKIGDFVAVNTAPGNLPDQDRVLSGLDVRGVTHVAELKVYGKIEAPVFAQGFNTSDGWAIADTAYDVGGVERVLHGIKQDGSIHVQTDSGPLMVYSPAQLQQVQQDIQVIYDDISDLKEGVNTGNTIKSFVDTLCNPFRDKSFVVIGASVEWGLTLPGNSPSSTTEHPRAKLLSDLRDNLLSPSYVNKMRFWLGHGYLDLADDAMPTEEDAPGSTGGGSGYFTDPNQGVEVKHDRRVALVSDGGMILPRAGSPVTGASVLDPLEVPAGASIVFEMHGDNFSVVYGTTVAGGNIQVFVDDVEFGTQSYTGAVSWQNVYPVAVPIGTHMVRVRNAGSGPLRIEQIKRVVTLRVVNQGIIGAGTNEWRPGSSWHLLENCLPPDANFALINLGSNDRASALAPATIWKVKERKREIIRWLRDHSVQSFLGGSSPASPDFPNEGSAYKFSQLQIGRINRELAQEEGISSIDRYVRSMDRRWIDDPPTWQDYLVPGDNHPNEAGHRLILDSFTEQFIKYTDI